MDKILSMFGNITGSPADAAAGLVVGNAPLYEFNKYKGCVLTKRIHHAAGRTHDAVTFKTSDCMWEVDMQEEACKPVSTGQAGQRILFRFKIVDGACTNASVGAVFHLKEWSEDVHLFMPGAVYKGNRFRSYPCSWYGCYEKRDAKPSADQIVADIPRLNWRKRSLSRIQLLTRDLTTPAVGFWYPAKKKAVFFLTDQGDARGDTLIEVGENSSHNDAWVRFTLPGVREGTFYSLNGRQPSPDRGASFTAGETVMLKLIIYEFPCKDLRSFHEFFFGIRRTELPDRPELPGVTLSRASELQHKVVSEDRWSEKHRIFWDEKNPNWYFQTGWTGGMMKDFPVYVTGNAADRKHVKEALRTYNGGWSPSGLMYGRFDKKGYWSSDNAVPGFEPLEKRPYMKDWTLSRRHGDVLIYLHKTVRFIRREESAFKLPHDFLANLRRSADVLCGIFEKYGQLGQYLDQNTGEIRVGGSTAAANIPSGLLLAWQEFGDEKYLKTAQALANQIYNQYTVHGNMNGTPADILQSPDCEGPTLLLASLCDLYDVTGDKQWLVRAEHCAWLLSTWVSSYDYDFSRHFSGSEFQRLNIKTVGAIVASSQNMIGTPGLCVSSGLPLLRLYRATGDVRHLDLLRDIEFCLMRAMARPERLSLGEDGSPIPAGWIAERFSTTDVHMPASFWKASTPWCQTAMMLTCLEIPSVYIVADRKLVYAFDTIRVNSVKTGNNSVQLTVTNPTEFPAKYKVMLETAGELDKPLPLFHFERFRSFDFQPNETRTITIPAGAGQ